MDIEQDARRASGPRHRQQRRTIRKADDLIATRRQDHRQDFTNGGIVVDNEDLASGERFIGHMPSSIDSKK
jgi:hypothetical protein